ncbi:hypothetical protein DN748_07285 [Sinomicrobium soli]|nr:hypothetical protein DN748_07285 [Sinomicrobium sp. N-1-3-6]
MAVFCQGVIFFIRDVKYITRHNYCVVFKVVMCFCFCVLIEKIKIYVNFSTFLAVTGTNISNNLKKTIQ